MGDGFMQKVGALGDKLKVEGAQRLSALGDRLKSVEGSQKFTALGDRIKTEGADLTRKMSIGMTSVTEKMRDLFQTPTPADKLVEEATSEALRGSPDWGRSMEICDAINAEQLSRQAVVNALKKRFALKSDPHIQLLALALLETCLKNCEKMWADVASERFLNDMVRAVDDPETHPNVRERVLKLIQSWGEATEELRYLPIYEETYKSLKSRGVWFPPGNGAESSVPSFPPAESAHRVLSETQREAGGWQEIVDTSPENAKKVLDVARNSVELLSTVLSSSPQQDVLKEELASTLVEQCRQAQIQLQWIIVGAGDSEALLFEALTINDDLQSAISKYEGMLNSTSPHQEPLQTPSSESPLEEQHSIPASVPVVEGSFVPKDIA